MRSLLRRFIPLILGAAVSVVAVVSWPAGGDDGGALVARFAGPSLGAGNAYAAPAAYARRTITPEFESPLPLTTGREIMAAGPFGCTAGEGWRVDVALTQAKAVAKGAVRGKCKGRKSTWRVVAVAVGPQSFRAGAARGLGTFTLTRGGKVTDSFHWAERVVLQAG